MTRLICILCLLTLTHINCANNDTEEDTTPDQSSSQDMADMTADVAQDTSNDLEDGDMEVDASADMDMAPETRVIPPGPWDISKEGPYSVGYQMTTMSYDAKPDQPGRKLELAIWYPSVVKNGRAARYARILTRRNVFNEAPIAPEGKFPVMIFSHGNSSLAEQSYFMTEYFASHGWVVVAPYHTGNSIRDTQGSVNYRSALYRPQDITAILDWLEALPQDIAIKGRLTEQIALSGHSFGGYTTLASAGGTFNMDEINTICQNNPPNQKLCDVFSAEADQQVFRDGFVDARLKAAIPHTPAGAFFFGEGLKNIKIPTMLMTGARDKSLPNSTEGDPIWTNLSSGSDHVRLDFPQGGHFTFSNMCELFPSLEQVATDGCDDTFIPVDTALPIIRQYTLAFAQFHLLNDMRHAGLLSGDEQPWRTHVTFSKK